MGKTLINAGSVGCPTNSQAKSQFIALEFTNNEWIDTLINIEYDIEKLVSAFHESSIIEKSKMWGYSMIKQLETGINYTEKVLIKAYELAKMDNMEIPTEIHWELSAKKFNVI